MNIQFAKLWKNGLVRFPDEKPVFGEIRQGCFFEWLEIVPKKIDGVNDRITIIKSTEPRKIKCGSLLEPQIIQKFKSKFTCLKAFVRANQDMALRVHEEMNK